MHLTATITGGCQCGAVRYRISAPIFDQHVCHCRMCQKAVGGPFAAIAVADKSALYWTRGQPARFRSSINVDRGFCQKCGTPLTYDDQTSEHIGVLTGSLDRPAAATPLRQDGIEGRLDWVLGLSTMPEKLPTGENDDAGWADNIRSSARQHPDHDTNHWPPAA